MSGVRPLEYDDGALRDILRSVASIAMVGASANPARASHSVMKYLLAKGYRVVPVNPGLAGQTLIGQTCYGDLSAVPGHVDMVDVFRAPEAVPGILDEVSALPVRPRVLWMQLGVRDDAAAARAEAEGMTVIMDRCPAIEYERLFGAARE